MRPCLLTSLLLALAAVPLAGATGVLRNEVPVVTDEAAARAVLDQARKADDLWTILQVEAWAEGRPAWRTSPTFAKEAVIGSPLFAFPSRIQDAWERPDHLAVVTRDRCYRLAPDGRPLSASVRLAVPAVRADLSWSGIAVGTADLRRDGEQWQLSLASAALPEGRVLGTHTVVLDLVREGESHWLDGDLVVADDTSREGWAVAQAVNHGPMPEPRLALLTAAGLKPMPGLQDAKAVGPAGRWLVARRVGAGFVIIDRVGAETPLRTWAPGGGLLAVRTAQGLGLVDEAGDLKPWVPNGALLGPDPDLWTVGCWLVVSSGEGARRPPLEDFLGNRLDAGGTQPETLHLYRWEQLRKDRASPPVESVEGRFRQARAHAFSLLQWRGRQVSLLDLRGERPARTPLAELPAPVQDIRADHHHYQASLADGTRAVIDAAGRLLWQGQVRNCWVRTRRHLLVETGPQAWSLATLDPEAAKRSTVVLSLPAQDWHIAVDGFSRRVVANNGDGWQELDITGKGLRSHLYPPPLVRGRLDPPRCWSEDDLLGRFYRHHGRLLTKAQGLDAPPRESWSPQDALRIGRSAALIDADGFVIRADPARRDKDIRLGRFDDIEVFARARGGSWLFAAQPEGRRLTPHACLDGSLSLADLPADLGCEAIEDPRWRIDQRALAYVIPPSADALAWDDDQAGFRPARLRPTAEGRLLAITASVVLELRPDQLATVSRKVKR